MKTYAVYLTNVCDNDCCYEENKNHVDEESREILIEYRDRNVLGGGNFGNIVVYKDDQVLGYFSYNGRLWSGYPKNWQTNEEIIVEEQE